MTGTELILPDGRAIPIRDHRAVTREDVSGAMEVLERAQRQGGDLGSSIAAELRDPRASTTRTSWTSPSMPQIDEWNADQAFRYGYAMNVVAYRCVQLRARAIAAVPLVAGKRKGDYKTINENARIAKLLGPPPGGPAPKLSVTKLIRWTMAQKIVTGRRAWEIERDDRGDPVAFWPLAAAHLRALPTKSGTEWFRAFHYGPAHDPVKLKPEDVFYGWDPSGVDFRQAESELQVGRFDLSLVTLCDRYSLGFLRNQAVPAAIITTTAFPTEEKRRKFLQNWSSEFSGPDNAGRMALNEVGDDGDGPVGDSIDVKVLGLSAKDARLIEQRKEVTRELAIALGTPWSKLDASGRTFDNAGVEDRDWWENTQLPDMVDLEDDINMQLAPQLGDEVVWFDLRQVRALQDKKKPVTQTVGVPALLQTRAVTINEGRADYGLEPVPDGDRFLTFEEINALAGRVWPPAPPAPALPPAPTSGGPEPEPVEVDGEPANTDRTPSVETREVDPEAIEQRRTRIWRAADAVVTALEARWERSWRRHFGRQEDATMSRLTGKRGRQALEQRDPAEPIDPEAIFTRSHWLAEAEQLALDLYEETTAAGLARLSMSFGVSFDIASQWAQDFIAARANQLAGQVTTTTYEAIQRALSEGVTAGESIDEIADRVRAVFTQATQNRATVIARTEVISAYNGSSVLGATQLTAEVVAGQEWIATRDSRTRDAHAAADGQTVAIGVSFDVGGDQLAYPGDPAGRAANTVQCRCTVAFLTSEEMAEVQGRASLAVEHRTAKALMRFVPVGEFDELGFRRALEEAAA